MTRISTLLHRFLKFALAATILPSSSLFAEESLVYQERFINLTGSNAPWSSVPGWKAYTNDETGQGDGLIGGAEDPQGSVDGKITGNISGSTGMEISFDENDAGYVYIYRFEEAPVNVIVINNTVTIDRDDQEISRIRFAVRDDNSPLPSSQVAVKVSGSWYVHATPIETEVLEERQYSFREFAWTTQNWKRVNFNLEDMASLSISSDPAAELPAGDLEGVGLWINHTGGGISAVLDEYEVYVGEAASNAIADFGLAADYNWSNKTDFNRSFEDIVETDSSLSVKIGDWAQVNWELAETLDLSSHDAVPITVLASIELETAEKFRIWIYDDLGNVGAIEYTDSFADSIQISQDQWGYWAHDDFGVQGTGELDWSRISKIGFRVQSSGHAILSIDKILFGQIDSPDTGGNGDSIPDPFVEPYTFLEEGTISGPTLLEAIKVTDNLLLPDHRLNGADWHSPTVSRDGIIFYTYIDPDQDISVMARYPNGTTESSKVILQVDDNDHHVEPSLGIDQEGILHLVGNMHNARMNYFRSDNPLDVSTWTFYGRNLDEGGIEGDGVTYPYFFNAPDGTLFISFRSSAKVLWEPGKQGAAMARYDMTSGKWTMLGNLVEQLRDWERVANNLIIWDNSGSGGNGGYQGYKIRPAFSTSGRLHLSWNIARNPDPAGTFGTSSNHTHVMYAYSDDMGDTWKQADGSAVDPPLGSDNVEPVFISTTESLFNNSAIGFTSDDRPIIGQRDNAINDMRWWVWSGSTWLDFPRKAQSAPGLIMTGPYGTITAFDGNKINRSWDDGQTWKAYRIPFNFSSFNNYADLNHFRKTGILRVSSVVNGGGVQSIEFSEVPAPVDGELNIHGFNPPGAAYGRPYESDIIAGGGNGDYAFTITEGSLPPGLVLQADGRISGVPIALGEFRFSVQVVDGRQATHVAEKTLQVEEFRYLPLRNVQASDFDDDSPPEYAVDGKMSSRWSTSNMGGWILLDLGVANEIDQVALNFTGSGSRRYTFSIEVSTGSKWITAFEGTTELSSQTQFFDLSHEGAIRYIRLIGYGSSADSSTKLNEIGVLQLMKTPDNPWPGAVEVDGWKSTWLGWLSDSSFPLVYSLEHGWLYTQVAEGQGAWFYSFRNELGWVYTNPILYNLEGYTNFYHTELGWLFYYLGTNPRWFQRYETGENFQLPLP